jgi:hypothetical protein
MLRFHSVMPVLALAAVCLAVVPHAAEKLPIGSKAPLPKHAMPGPDGAMHSIASTARANGVLVLFSSPRCAWVNAWQDRYATIARAARRHDIGMLVVNANADARSKSDSLAAMTPPAPAQNDSFPYVQDRNARLADAFGATTTPGAFLFDGSLTLVYRGAIDDNARNADAVEHPYLLSALEAVGTGGAVRPRTTEAVGCPIQRPE